MNEVFPFLRNVSQAVQDDIASHGIYRTIPAGSRIYWEGDTCTHIAFVLEGEIRVFKTGSSGREITLYELGPGETCILNASCILSRQGYPAHAATLGDVGALLLPAPVFKKLVSSNESFRTFVFSMLSQRLVTLFELIDEIVFGKLDMRLQEYLLEKSEDNVLTTTHQSIANDLGTSREVVSRLLKDFERHGLVTLGRNRIELGDLADTSL